MSGLESARMQRRLSIADLDFVLPACGPVLQFCKVSCEDGAGAIALKALAYYMARDRQVISRRCNATVAHEVSRSQ